MKRYSIIAAALAALGTLALAPAAHAQAKYTTIGHRRRDRGYYAAGGRLPPGQQGPRQARHSMLGGVDRRLGVQHQTLSGRGTGPGRGAVGRAFQRGERLAQFRTALSASFAQ